LRTLGLMVIAVLFTGLATYMTVGNPRLLVTEVPKMAPQGDSRAPDPNRVAALAEQMQGADQAQVEGTIAGMVAGLRARLEAEGGTAAEWDRLVRSYATLEDINGLAFAVEGLLGVDPQNPQALILAGQIATERGDRAGAKAYFMRLLPLIDPEHPRFEQIRSLIETFDADESTSSEN